MIETFELTKRYRRTVALRDVSLSIPAGGITALVGPNGAGKSTLLKLCIGFERPSAGRLVVCGVDPVRDRRGAVSSIGFVPQAPSLYRDISIADHLDLAAAIRPGFDRASARGRLHALEIDLRARGGELSGGQAAQVTLAIALGTRAPLLLLDEPLASLDPLARHDFLRIAKDAAKAGDVTIVLSSHVISEIEMTADRLLVFTEGAVVFHDTVAGSVANHRVIEPGDPRSGLDVIAPFPGRADDEHLLVRSTNEHVGRAPNVEEVVLGYLAASRSKARSSRTDLAGSVS